ncbi:MAG: hypothetical protein O2819_02325 [Planctomycetota bacterium]|nr:hypothetical protein [Planctomycetota bacterium]MDA1106487.1 hypothetical protein [Planctomycetota bacterium]
MGRTHDPRARFVAILAVAFAIVLGTAAAAQSVIVESMGVGGWYRPGTPTGILVRASADVEQASEAELVWELDGPDGDRLEVSRRVIVEPGRTVRAWLYGTVMPVAGSEFTEFTVRLWEVIDGERSRELGRTRFSPDALQPPVRAASLADDLALVVGSATMGLEQFDFDTRSGGFPATLNGSMHTATVADPALLPDRATGLRGYGVIVWSEPLPQSLPPAQAAALLDWISRGGHLVVAPTGADDAWGAGTLRSAPSHALRELIPERGLAGTRREGVLVRDLLSTLSKSSTLTNRAAVTDLWTFDAATLPSPWRPLAALAVPRSGSLGVATPAPDSIQGELWAVRRTWGTGLVSFLGIDADSLSRRALQPGGFPQASAFWGPIIGRRGDALTRQEFTPLAQADPSPLVRGSGATIDLLGGVIRSSVDIGTQAIVGVLLAFGLFAAYWVLAVPVAFYALKSRGLERHSWLAYTTLAIVFSGVAWITAMVATAGATSGARVRHLSVVDLVIPPVATEKPEATAHGWASIQLPGYGRAEILLRDAAPGDTLAAFAEPDAMVTGFPDTQAIHQSVLEPAVLDMPSRATATLVEYQSSSLSPRWRGAVSLQSGQPITCEVSSAGGTVRARMNGSLVHSLPVPMESVYIVLVAPVRSPTVAMLGSPASPSPEAELSLKGAMRFTGSWQPGRPLDLGATLGTVVLHSMSSAENELTRELEQSWTGPLRSRSVLGVESSALSTPQRLAAASLFGLLAPPAYLKARPDAAELGDTTRIGRSIGHELDLGGHAAGGAVIIIGAINGELPVELAVAGASAESGGLTIVRSIIPLGSDGRWLAPSITGDASVARLASLSWR